MCNTEDLTLIGHTLTVTPSCMVERPSEVRFSALYTTCAKVMTHKYPFKWLVNLLIFKFKPNIKAGIAVVAGGSNFPYLGLCLLWLTDQFSCIPKSEKYCPHFCKLERYIQNNYLVIS